MELPQLPTDNLYKFMALSGISIIAISLIPFLHAHKLMVEAIRLRGDINILGEQVSWTTNDRKLLQDKIDILEQDVDNLKQSVDAVGEDDAKTSDRGTLVDISDEKSRDLKDTVDQAGKLRDRLEEISELTNEFAELSKNDSISLLQLKAKGKEHLYMMIVVTFEFVVSIWGFIYGIKLARKGFKLWYVKLQVFQDKIIQLKSKEK